MNKYSLFDGVKERIVYETDNKELAIELLILLSKYEEKGRFLVMEEVKK
jgi:hypothetical protein